MIVKGEVTGVPSCVPISYNDLHCGKVWAIKCTYLYDSILDFDKLASSLSLLLKELPTLGGYFMSDTMSIDTSNPQVEFNLDRSDEHLSLGKIDLEARFNTSPFIQNPVDIVNRKDRCMKVWLHIFKEGSALSVCFSHAVCDGSGMYNIVNRWAALTRATPSDGSCIIPTTMNTSSRTEVHDVVHHIGGGDLAQKLLESRHVILHQHERRDHDEFIKEIQSLNHDGGVIGDTPHSFRGCLSRWRRSIYYSICRSVMTGLFRFKIYFSKSDIERLKETAEKDCESDGGVMMKKKKKFSTNQVIVAHVLRVYCDYYKFDSSVHVGTVYQARGRYRDLPINFIGNSSYFTNINIHQSNKVEGRSRSDATCAHGVDDKRAVQDMSLGEVALVLHNLINGLSHEAVERDMRLLEDSFHNGYSIPQLRGDGKQFIVSNNHTSFPVYDADFGKGPPSGIVPHNIGDHILVVKEKREDDGCTVYISDCYGRRSIKGMMTKEWLERLQSGSETSA